MQTIIYTNNKREGSNYQVDRIVYSDGIEVNQLIENQMERYNISHIHFWFVRENVNRMDDAKQETMLVNIGKYLIENKDSNFKFEYIVEKYQQNQEKKERKSVDNQRNFRNTDSNDSMVEKMSNKQQKNQLIRQEIIKEQIKFTHFKQFEIFIKKELKSNLDAQIIKKYLFQTNDQTIGISFFQASQKELIHKIIEQDCNQIYNAKLHYRKISTIHPQDYQKSKKKMQSYEEPIQLYHRVILYLFTTEKIEQTRDTKLKKNLKTNAPLPPKNLSIQALQSWKIQQQTQSLIKYQKQCELIAQQIQNEKIIFRNKIKLIENYIGDTINVEKLFQEEEQIQTTNIMVQQMSNTIGSTTLKKMPLLAKRASITPAISQTITNNLEKLSKYNNSHINPSFLNVSEFKRLKEISEAMRTIDNTIFEQNKKIEQLKSKAKDLLKLKEEILFKNAKEFNSIKKELLQLTQQIERKENEIQQKKKNGEFQAYLQYKNKQPSQKAKENLAQHIKFVSLHQKPQSFDTKPFIQYDYQDNNGQEEKSTNRSLHRKQFKEIVNSSILKFREKKLKQVEKTMDKSKKFDQKGFDFEDSFIPDQKVRYNSIHKLDATEKSSSDFEKQLVQLYHYYSKNEEIIKTINKQTQKFRCLNQADMAQYQKQKLYKNRQERLLQQSSQIQMNIEDFPILKELLLYESVEGQPLMTTSCSKSQPHFHAQSLYPNDYFELMIKNQKKKSIKKQTKDESLRSTMKDTDIDRASESIITPKATMQQPNIKLTPNNAKIWGKPSKFKRITIEQAININSFMKKLV